MKMLTPVELSSLCRRPGVLLLSMYRAGSEDMRCPGRTGFWGDQHPRGPAAGPRRANPLPAAARLWSRALRSDPVWRNGENSSHRGTKPDLRHPEDHHPAQRSARSHGVLDLRYQAENLNFRTSSALFSPPVHRTWVYNLPPRVFPMYIYKNVIIHQGYQVPPGPSWHCGTERI